MQDTEELYHKIELLERENAKLKIFVKVELLESLFRLSQEIQLLIDRAKFIDRLNEHQTAPDDP